MKGFSIGDAEVSPVHANFIINREKATSADILKLMDRVKRRVLEKSGVALLEEVVIW